MENNTYSGDGNRMRETVGSSSIVYTYQGSSDILFQKNLTSSVITKNYYANGLLIGEIIGGTRYYLLDDLLGSIRDVTTSTVSSVFSSNYKPYGSSYDLTLSLPDTFYYYYTHKPYDPSTGLYYYGARYYLPSINRFITEDGVQYSSIASPLTLNRYVYALNNPETNSDPSGNMIDMWSRGSTNMEPPAPPPPKPPVVTVPPQTPQSGEASYRWGNMISNTNHNNYLASIEKYTIPQKHQQTQSQPLSSSKLDFKQWLARDFFFQSMHLAQLAGIVVDIIALIFPTAQAWGGKISKAAVSFFSSWSFSGYDGGELASSIMQGNTAGLLEGLAANLGDFMNYFWGTLNLWDQLAFGASPYAVTVLGDAATVGAYQAYADVFGGIKLGIDAGIYLYDLTSGWESYSSS